MRFEAQSKAGQIPRFRGVRARDHGGTRKQEEKSARARNTISFPFLSSIRALLLFSCLLLLAVPALAEGPSWWQARGVLDTNTAITNDFAPLLTGQLKWFATNAYDELEANLTGGAGSDLSDVLSQWLPD